LGSNVSLDPNRTLELKETAISAIDTQPQPAPHLVRQIGLASGIAVVMGSMIGSGIFKVPSVIAGRLPGPGPMLAVWLVGAVFALCGAMTVAEVGGAFPYSGGFYVFIREAYGRLPAFLFGWCNVLSQPASNGAVALVFSQYALRLSGHDPGEPGFAVATALLAVTAMVVVTVANIRGVKFGAGIQNLTTMAKVGGLLALIFCAVAIGLPRGAHFSPAAPPGSFSVSMFGLSLVSVLFAYDGWMNITYIGGEVSNPRRNMPLSILFGVSAVAAIYISANVAYMIVSPVADIAGSQIIAADTMYKPISPAARSSRPIRCTSWLEQPGLP
jgi:amino acid transporter